MIFPGMDGKQCRLWVLMTGGAVNSGHLFPTKRLPVFFFTDLNTGRQKEG
jgi:hypothetical protein